MLDFLAIQSVLGYNDLNSFFRVTYMAIEKINYSLGNGSFTFSKKPDLLKITLYGNPEIRDLRQAWKKGLRTWARENHANPLFEFHWDFSEIAFLNKSCRDSIADFISIEPRVLKHIRVETSTQLQQYFKVLSHFFPQIQQIWEDNNLSISSEVDIEKLSHTELKNKYNQLYQSLEGSLDKIYQNIGNTLWESEEKEFPNKSFPIEYNDNDTLATFYATLNIVQEDFKETISRLQSEVKTRKASEQNMGVILNTVSVGLIILCRGKILFCNESLAQMLDLRRSDILRLSLEELLNPEYTDFLNHHIENLQLYNYSNDIIEIPLNHNNTMLWTEFKIQNTIFDGKQCVIASINDITQRKEAEKNVHHMAYYDQLTGLPNRYSLEDKVSFEINRTRRHKTKLAFLFIDLDRFKTINDSLGHHIGDQLLKEVANRLKTCIRSTDFITRQGGDEFVILLTDLNKAEQALPVLSKIQHAFERPIILEENELFVSCSIGVCLFPEDGESLEDILKHADLAMYQAKKAGGGGFKFFTSNMQSMIKNRLQLETHLRYAITENQFSLHYQPIIDSRTNQTVSAEALIRWDHPSMGRISPAEFIPLAEETGLIIQIGEWVIKEVCRQQKDWLSKDISVRVAINLSPLQFKSPNLIETIESSLLHYNIPSRMIKLEVTEGCLMDDIPASIELLSKFQEKGIDILVDDFGTGYSSLSYLQKLPINCLKIDQSFVRDLEINDGNDAIVQAIIAMGNSLSLDLIAEGVETVEELNWLKKNNCNNIQGYYFSKPMPKHEAEAFFKSKRTPEES